MKNYVLIPITVVSIVVSYFIWQAMPEYIKRGGPLLVFGLISLLAGNLRRWLSRHTGADRWLHQMAAIVYVSLALRLLLV